MAKLRNNLQIFFVPILTAAYRKDPEDKKRWIVDEEAAAVVQKIFALCMNGMGVYQISQWLREQRILCPTAYHLTQGRKNSHNPPKDPCKWSMQAVAEIIRKLEYLGHTVNFRTTKESYKSKKLLLNTPDEWVIIENTQEPIIEQSVFWTVQNIRQGRRRVTKTGEPDMFSGLLWCADCENKMYRIPKYNGKDTHFYICAKYHLSGRDANRDCSAHYIGNLALDEIVLKNLREAIAYVAEYEDDFIRELSVFCAGERDRELAKQKDELVKAGKRVAELDLIIKRLYEDNISGKLTDERFIKLSRDYEREQDELKATAAALNKVINQREQKKTDVRNFVTVAKKYTDLQELDAGVLREFIERIYISEKDKETKTQEIRIVYNFIGAFDFAQATEQSTNNIITEEPGVA